MQKTWRFLKMWLDVSFERDCCAVLCVSVACCEVLGVDLNGMRLVFLAMGLRCAEVSREQWEKVVKND